MVLCPGATKGSTGGGSGLKVPQKMGHGFKVSKVAKIRNRYNQVPHLTQDTNGKVTNSQKTSLIFNILGEPLIELRTFVTSPGPPDLVLLHELLNRKIHEYKANF